MTSPNKHCLVSPLSPLGKAACSGGLDCLRLGIREMFHFVLLLFFLQHTCASPVLFAPFASQITGTSPSAQLSSVVALPLGAGVRVPPTWSFSIGFQPNTFISTTDSPLSYDARLDNSKHLPSWLQFDEDSFTLTGTAPHHGIYNVTITCAEDDSPDVVSDSFIIVVEKHTIEQTLPFDPIYTVARNEIFYQVNLSRALMFDGAPPTADQIDSTQLSPDLSDLPWMTWDRCVQRLLALAICLTFPL